MVERPQELPDSGPVGRLVGVTTGLHLRAHR